MRKTFLFCCLAGMLGSAAFGDTLYGSYQFTATHACNDPQCTQATDTITGTGSNSVQGASTLSATNLTEIDSANPQITGPFTLTSASDGSQLFGFMGFSFSPGTAGPTSFGTIGTAQFSGGTGPYAAFSAFSPLSGMGIFTSPTTAQGTLTFTPEPESWAELLLSLPVLTLSRRFRRRQS